MCVSALQAEQSIPKVMALVLYHSCGARDNQCYHSLRPHHTLLKSQGVSLFLIKQVFDFLGQRRNSYFLVKQGYLLGAYLGTSVF